MATLRSAALFSNRLSTPNVKRRSRCSRFCVVKIQTLKTNSRKNSKIKEKKSRTCGDMDLKLPMMSVNKRRLKGKDQSVADLADKRALTSRSLTPGCEKNLSGRSLKT